MQLLHCTTFLPVYMFKIFHNLFDLHFSYFKHCDKCITLLFMTLQLKLNSMPTLTNFAILSLCVISKFGIAYFMSYHSFCAKYHYHLESV